MILARCTARYYHFDFDAAQRIKIIFAIAVSSLLQIKYNIKSAFGITIKTLLLIKSYAHIGISILTV